MKSYFITGVDTDIGKTFVSLGLYLSKENQGYSVGYYKPLQSGAYVDEKGILCAPDVEEFKKYTKVNALYSYLLKGEVSPYLASSLNNIEIDLEKIKKDYPEFSKNFDYTFLEGAGGLYCPASRNYLFSDIIKELNIETIIVTTPDLGRINHTLMTIDCAKRNNIKIKGLIINSMPENKTLSQEHFEQELKNFCDVEILGIIPKMKPTKDNIIKAFDCINL